MTTQAQERPVRFDVTDVRTGKVVASMKSRDMATRYADRRDEAFGAVCMVVTPVWA